MKDVSEEIRKKSESAKNLDDVQIRSEFLFKVKLLSELIRRIDRRGKEEKVFSKFFEEKGLDSYVFVALLSKLKEMGVLNEENECVLKRIANKTHGDAISIGTKEKFVKLSEGIKFYKYKNDMMDSLKQEDYIIIKKGEDERLILRNFEKYKNGMVISKLGELARQKFASFRDIKDVEEINETMDNVKLKYIMELNEKEDSIKTLDDIKEVIKDLDSKSNNIKFYIFEGDKIDDTSNVCGFMDNGAWYIFNQPTTIKLKSASKVRKIIAKEGFVESKKGDISEDIKRFMVSNEASLQCYQECIFAKIRDISIKNRILSEAFELINKGCTKEQIEKKMAKKENAEKEQVDKDAWIYLKNIIEKYAKNKSQEGIEEMKKKNKYYKFKDEDVGINNRILNIGTNEFLIYNSIGGRFNQEYILKKINNFYKLKTSEGKEKLLTEIIDEEDYQDCMDAILYKGKINSLNDFLKQSYGDWGVGDYKRFNNEELAQIYDIIIENKEIGNLFNDDEVKRDAAMSIIESSKGILFEQTEMAVIDVDNMRVIKLENHFVLYSEFNSNDIRSIIEITKNIYNGRFKCIENSKLRMQARKQVRADEKVISYEDFMEEDVDVTNLFVKWDDGKKDEFKVTEKGGKMLLQRYELLNIDLKRVSEMEGYCCIRTEAAGLDVENEATNARLIRFDDSGNRFIVYETFQNLFQYRNDMDSNGKMKVLKDDVDKMMREVREIRDIKGGRIGEKHWEKATTTIEGSINTFKDKIPDFVGFLDKEVTVATLKNGSEIVKKYKDFLSFDTEKIGELFPEKKDSAGKKEDEFDTTAVKIEANGSTQGSEAYSNKYFRCFLSDSMRELFDNHNIKIVEDGAKLEEKVKKQIEERYELLKGNIDGIKNLQEANKLVDEGKIDEHTRVLLMSYFDFKECELKAISIKIYKNYKNYDNKNHITNGFGIYIDQEKALYIFPQKENLEGNTEDLSKLKEVLDNLEAYDLDAEYFYGDGDIDIEKCCPGGLPSREDVSLMKGDGTVVALNIAKVIRFSDVNRSMIR